MRYNEIIKEANYRGKIDTSKTYPTEAEFDAALKAKFGVTDQLQQSKPQAGGGVYLISYKGIAGYRVPNTDSPEGHVWYLAKELFMPASKRPHAKPASPVAAKPAPAKPKVVSPEVALQDLLSHVKSIKTQRMYGSYDTYGPEQRDSFWEADIRHWGIWQIPDGEEDDGDYDWEELTDESAHQLDGIMEEFSKRYPDIKFSWGTGEKNWIYLRAKAK